MILFYERTFIYWGQRPVSRTIATWWDWVNTVALGWVVVPILYSHGLLWEESTSNSICVAYTIIFYYLLNYFDLVLFHNTYMILSDLLCSYLLQQLLYWFRIITYSVLWTTTVSNHTSSPYYRSDFVLAYLYKLIIYFRGQIKNNISLWKEVS